MSYVCRICDWRGEIPDDAVELTHRRHSYLYRFSDGAVHDLRRIRPISADLRWHNSPRPDCVFCFPPPKPEPQPEPPVKQEVQAPVPEPEPKIMVEEVKPEIGEDELTAITALAAA